MSTKYIMKPNGHIRNAVWDWEMTYMKVKQTLTRKLDQG